MPTEAGPYHCVASPPSARVSALNCSGIERQRGDGIDGEHRRSAAIAPIERFQVPMAFVAGVNPVSAIAAGERRNAAAIAVFAVGAGNRIEPPLTRAAAADQETLGGGVDEREFRLAAAERAAGLTPVGQFQPWQERLGTP